MEQVLQTAVLCVAAAILALTVRRGSPETALLLTVAAAAVTALWVLDGLSEVLSFLQEMASRSGVPAELFLPLYKTAGIALVVRVGSSLCRDAGESALGSVLETAGAVCALTVSLPLLRAVVNLLMELME